MNSNRKTARIVGALFLTAMVTSLLGGGLLESILNAPDYLNNISENSTLVLLGIFLELINGLAVVGIAVMLFPILKQHNERIALGYVGLRIVESVFCIFSAISPLSLITLNQEYVKNRRFGCILFSNFRHFNFSRARVFGRSVDSGLF